MSINTGLVLLYAFGILVLLVACVVNYYVETPRPVYRGKTKALLDAAEQEASTTALFVSGVGYIAAQSSTTDKHYDPKEPST